MDAALIGVCETSVCDFAASSGSGDIVFDGIVFAMQITLLAMQGAFDLGLAAVLDTLETANELAASMESPPPPLGVTLVGIGRRVQTGRGFVVPVRAANSAPRPNAVVLPALGAKMPAGLLEKI
jgi:hypothetical protein